MSKKKRIKAFVDSLSEAEVRKQLCLAYLQMERCQRVLRGENVVPFAMKDNGFSSDLELFYLCKKKAVELELLEDESDEHDQQIAIQALVHVFGSEEEVDVVLNKMFHKGLDAFIDKNFKPSKKVLDAIRKYAKECKPQPKFKVGDVVYIMSFNTIEKLKVVELTDGKEHGWHYLLAKGTARISRPESYVFATVEELLSHLKNNVNGEEKELNSIRKTSEGR